MNMTGNGSEAPGQQRVEQFHIHLFFDKELGLIRSFGNDIQSPKTSHHWIAQPSEWDEMFAPTQPIKEITQIVVDALSTY
jgi:hypothetical protein